MGFYDKAFEAKAKRAGFINGYAWCMIACEVVWVEALETVQTVFKKDLKDLIKEVESEISPSTIQSWSNFKESKSFIRVTTDPEPGDIVIFVNTKNRTTGHAGIVIKSIDGGYFKSVEGNSNNDGSREGNQMVGKTRLTSDRDGKGLDVLGFVRLKDRAI